MGYYIRVLGTSDPNIHLDELIDGLKADGLSAKFAYAHGNTPDNWTHIEVSTDNGDVLTQIERNSVVDGELGAEELDEFKDIVQEYKPKSAVQWLTNYFENVKVIYAFQILDASFDDGNFEVVTSIKNTIWNKTAGIIQADNEGFTNDEGYHILWQFSDEVTGEWSCAIRDASGHWERFVMDLGDETQRQEFQNGKVPREARRCQ